MNEARQLWTTRMNGFWKEAAGYLRYVFNSGFLVFLMFTFIAGSYYYSIFVRQLPSDAKLEWFIVPVLALGVARGSVRTFLKEGDLVFLLPMEWKMDSYFRRSLIYSFIIKAFMLLFVIALLQPLYAYRFPEKGLMGIVTIVLFLGAYNLWANWIERKLHHRSDRSLHFIIRYIMSFVVLFIFVSSGLSLILTLGVAIVLISMLYYFRLGRKHVNWLLLLEIEKRQLFRFYSIVNLFVDVPHLQNRIKERRLVPSVARFLPFQKSSAYLYFYIKTFSRSNELLDMVARLTLFSGILLLMASKSTTGQWIIIGITLVMTAVQLSTLRKHHQYSIWLELYPIPQQKRAEAIHRIYIAILLVQVLIPAVIASFNKTSFPAAFGLTLLYGIAAALLLYVQHVTKMKKKPSPFK